MSDCFNEDSQLAVKKGANWLDEFHPGWVSRIDLDKLNMNNCYNCIIGQTVGEYFDSLARIVQRGYEGNRAWAIEHGFVPDRPQEGGSEYSMYTLYHDLEALWTEEVQKRLG